MPSLTGDGVELRGALRLSGTALDTYTTPFTGLGAPHNVAAKLSVVNFDLGAFSQMVAIGVTAGSDSTARGISVFDTRATDHAPSIVVLSPDDNQIGGFSWDGSNTNFRVKTSGGSTISLNVNGQDKLTAGTSGVDVLGTLTVTGDVAPQAASTHDLGSSALEWDELYLGDGGGVRLGLDQDATLAYDEATDDRVELTGSGAGLFVEDKLGLGVQTLTLTDDGTANDTLTPTASYIRVDQDETGNGGIPDLAFSETGAKDGDFIVIVNNELDASNDTFTVTDSAGVVNVNGSPKTIGPEDGVTFVYMNDRWVSIGFSDN